jgi:hypothetical protein
MQKKIVLPDFEAALATIAIGIKTKHSTNARVLAELIRCSENGCISQPEQAAPQIQKRLNISNESYKAAIAKLKKLKLINRDDGDINLEPLVQRCDSLLVQKAVSQF